MRLKIFFMVALAFVLSGCSPLVFDVDDLMQPPALSDEQSKIMQALQESLGGNEIKLKYPKMGNYRSAFVFKDLDNDGDDEAMVFYEQSMGSSNIARINILNHENNSWNSVYDMPGLGGDIEFVEFANLLSKDKSDLIIGWTITANSSKTTLSAYSFNENFTLNKLNDYDYNKYLIINSTDGLQQILTVTNSRNDPTAKLIKKRNSTKLGVISNVKLSREIESILNVSYGKTKSGFSAIFVDEYLFGNEIATEVLTVENGILKNNMMTSDFEKNDIYAKTFRSQMVLSEDVDNDGVIEIPFQSLMNGYGEDDETENIYLTSYNTFSEGITEVKQNAVLNQKDGYKIIIPQKWLNSVTAKVQPHNGEYSFVVFKNNLTLSTNEVLRIRVYSKDDYRDTFELEQFKKIATKGDFEYYAYIPQDVEEQYKITYDELNSMFVLIK